MTVDATSLAPSSRDHPPTEDGDSVPRKEDRRLLTGHGAFVADLRMPDMVHVAFVRSSLAHAEIVGIDLSGLRDADLIDIALGDDPDFENRAISAPSRANFAPTSQPILANAKTRFAGECVAMVAAADRYRAEDAAELIEVEYRQLPTVVRVDDPPSEVPVHASAPDNVLVRRTFEAGDVDAALGDADFVVERQFTTNRQAGMPMECRAVVARWDPADDSLSVWSSTQLPHLIRYALAEILGIPDSKVRVTAPDVGGGFGVKAVLYPEEVAVCLLARRHPGRAVKWVEDRVEHVQSATHAREHTYRVTAAFDADGTLTGMKADVACNAGAYSVYPWTAALEPMMAGGLLAGPYRVKNYRCDVRGVATNTSPAGPYRGVARPATVFVMERLMDIAAQQLGIDRIALRYRNLIRPDDIPYQSATRVVHDSTTYTACLDAVIDAVGHTPATEISPERAADGWRLGVGFACYNELTALGRAMSSGPAVPFRTAHDACTLRVGPGGGITLLAGVASQGQGLETTLAQIVARELDVDYDDVEVHYGDTRESLFGFGAFASRQGVIAGGAALGAARALKAKILALGAHLLELNEPEVELRCRNVRSLADPAVSIALKDVARVAYLEAHRLPAGLEPGLEATHFYDPMVGSFSAGAQGAVVEVHPATGKVNVLRLVCAEDPGTMINPKVVDGQIRGAVTQGIAGAVFEHMIYDEQGTLVTSSMADYLIPTAAEIPPVEIHHVCTPANNALGARGVGEGGTLGPAAAIANAVSQALDLELNDLPLNPKFIWHAVHP